MPLDAAVNALRKLGQRSTASVIAEEMECQTSEVPVVKMAAMAEQGKVFTCYLSNGTRLTEHSRRPIELSNCTFGLLDQQRR